MVTKHYATLSHMPLKASTSVYLSAIRRLTSLVLFCFVFYVVLLVRLLLQLLRSILLLSRSIFFLLPRSVFFLVSRWAEFCCGDVVCSELACSDPMFRSLHNRVGGGSADDFSVFGAMGR